MSRLDGAKPRSYTFNAGKMGRGDDYPRLAAQIRGTRGLPDYWLLTTDS